jgi:hypothetical protein
VCCFYLALNRDYWWPLVDTIMNFLKWYKRCGIS